MNRENMRIGLAGAGAVLLYILAIVAATQGAQSHLSTVHRFSLFGLAVISGVLSMGIGVQAARLYGRRALNSTLQRVRKIATESESKILRSQKEQNALIHNALQDINDEMNQTTNRVEGKLEKLLTPKAQYNPERVHTKLLELERRLVSTFESATLTISAETSATLQAQISEIRAETGRHRPSSNDSSRTSSSVSATAPANFEMLIARSQTLRESASDFRIAATEFFKQIPTNVKSSDAAVAKIADRIRALNSINDHVASVINGLESRLVFTLESRTDAGSEIDTEAREFLSAMGVDLQTLKDSISDYFAANMGSEHLGNLSQIMRVCSSYVGTLSSLLSELDYVLTQVHGNILSSRKVNRASELKQADDIGLAQPATDSASEKTARLDSQIRHHIDTFTFPTNRSNRRKKQTNAGTVGQVRELITLFSNLKSADSNHTEVDTFATTSDGVLLVSDVVRRHRPKVVVQLGTGLSTIWLAMLARAFKTRVVSASHCEKALMSTKQMIEDWGIDESVDLRSVPQMEVGNETSESGSLNPSVLDDLVQIDMLVVHASRQEPALDNLIAALPRLKDQLMPNAPVILDGFLHNQAHHPGRVQLGGGLSLTPSSWRTDGTMVFYLNGIL